MNEKSFANGNCEECSLQNMCPAPLLNWCPDVYHNTRWEMHLEKGEDYNV